MGARHKLNQIYITLALLLAAFFGLLTQSTTVFGIALVMLILTNIHSGSIRLNQRRCR